MTQIPANWRAAEFLSMEDAARILGISRAQLYRLAHLEELSLVRNLGRTVVTPAEVQRLARAAQPWTPSNRNAAAVAALKAKRTG